MNCLALFAHVSAPPLRRPAALLLAVLAALAVSLSGGNPAVANDGYEPDQQVVADVWDYARETNNGFDHVLRWMRVLKTFGVVADMSATEARGYADQHLAERWDQVVEELTKLEADDGYQPDQQVTANVWDYAGETNNGFDHVLRWMRVLKTFGAVSDMSAAEAQGYADQHLAERWDPVVAELTNMESWTPEPNRAPVVNAQADNYADFVGKRNAPRSVQVWKEFKGIFSDPDGDELTYAASMPADVSHLVDTLGISRAVSSNSGEKLDFVFILVDADDDWKTASPALADPLTITMTLTATDPDGLSASISGDFVTDWDSSPALVSATATRQAINLTFDQEVQGSLVPSSFTVNVANEDGTSAGTIAVSNVAINGTVVTLKLTSTLVKGQTVTLDYAHDDDTPLQRVGGGDPAPDFTGQTVAVDASGPAFAAATVSRSTLTVTFNEELDADSAPAGSAFTVAARLGGAEARSIAGTGPASVEGAVVTVALAEAVLGGDTLTVAYAPPSDGPVRDTAGNAADAFSAEEVINETPAINPGAPRMALISATVKGATLTLAFNDDVHVDWNTRSVPEASSFVVKVNGEAVSLAAASPVSVSTSAVILTLAEAVSASDTVTVSYTADWWNSIHSFAHNCCGYRYADNFTDEPVTNIMEDDRAPALYAAAVNGAVQKVSVVEVNGAVLTLTFDEQLDPNAEPAASAFSVTVNGQAVSFRPYSWMRAGRPVPALWDPVPVWINGQSVMLTLDATVRGGQAVTVQYDLPESGAKLQDLAGNTVAAFAATEVENRSKTPMPSVADMPPLIADVWSYAQETQNGYDHVLRWMRVLKTLGALSAMTAAEAQGFADADWNRWDPVAVELRKLENANDEYVPDQQLVTDVWSYTAETEIGFEHVWRWMRVLATLGVLEDMTADEAQDHADTHSAERWGPVADELRKKEASTS